MRKVMLVIDNEIERRFLEKLMKRLGFHVVNPQKSQELSMSLAESFPDVVFASIIGKSSKTLTSLANIKAIKGIPKVVFVRQSKDTSPLTPEQKTIVDGLLYSPIDPFKLLEILSQTTGIALAQLKQKYREVVMRERGQSVANVEKKPGVLIIDNERKKKYDNICMNLKEKNKDHAEFNPDKFREMQKAQSKAVVEDKGHRELKKNFIKTLFSADPRRRGDF